MRPNVAPKPDAIDPADPVDTTAKTNADESFSWPPPDDVLQNMAVIDFETGEVRPLKLDPPEGERPLAQPPAAGSVSPQARPASEPVTADSPGIPAATAAPAAAVAVTAPVPTQPSRGAPETPASRPAGRSLQRPPARWSRTTRIVAALTLLAVAAGLVAGWKLLGLPGSFQGRPALPASSAPEPASGAPATASTPPVTTRLQSPAAPQAATAVLGSVSVRTDTAGVRVWIDGQLRGRTPLTASDLQPGPHTVAVEGPGGRIQQSITVVQGSNATMFFATGAGSAAGGITISAPAEIEVREGGRVVGTSRAERILLEPGRHTLDLVNERLGYETRQVVDVAPGKFVPIAVQFPEGSLNINALPWAEVFVDGQRIGETPIGNLKVRVGPHEVLFRHPQLGEVRRTVDVTLRGPARISVDLERKER